MSRHACARLLTFALHGNAAHVSQSHVWHRPLQALLNVTGNDLLNQMYQAASVNGNASTLDTLDVSVRLQFLHAVLATPAPAALHCSHILRTRPCPCFHLQYTYLSR